MFLFAGGSVWMRPSTGSVYATRDTINLPCSNGRNYQVRRPGKPDERQKVIYAALGIDVGALPVRKVVVEPSPAGGA